MVQEALLLEIEKTIRLLEADIPASPASEANERLEQGLEREMARYFRALEDTIPWDRIEALYYKLV